MLGITKDYVIPSTQHTSRVEFVTFLWSNFAQIRKGYSYRQDKLIYLRVYRNKHNWFLVRKNQNLKYLKAKNFKIVFVFIKINLEYLNRIRTHNVGRKLAFLTLACCVRYCLIVCTLILVAIIKKRNKITNIRKTK